MKPTYILAALLSAIVTGFVAFKLLGQGRPPVEPNKFKAEKERSAASKISPQGPYPKVVVDADFDFGRMEVNEERSHVFTIQNAGEAPLIFEYKGTTCQCTVADKKEGETGEVA